MKYLFIAAFILAFVAGSFAWYLKQTENRPQGVLGNTLTRMGVKQKESLYSQHRAEIKDFIERQQQSMREDLELQLMIVENSRQQVDTMSGMMQQYMDDNNTDVLRMKQLVQDMQDQNRLMIERGKELMALNKEQLALRQQIFDQMQLDNWDNLATKERLDRQMENLMANKDRFLSISVRDNNDFLQRLENLNQHVSTSSTLSASQDSKIKELKNLSRDLMEKVKTQQERLSHRQEDDKLALERMQEQMRDFLDLQEQKFADTKDLLIEKKRSLDERTQDQLEHLKRMRESQLGR